MNSDDFQLFFRKLNNVEPFPWQIRLAKQVIEKGWPKSIAIPTSSGKTAIIDIALYSMAVDSMKSPQERSAPVRIFFVVDRRFVVDEAYERASRIKKRLTDALKEHDGILHEVASKLVMLADMDNSPIDVIRLRGGVPLEPSFIMNPLQPTVVISTVDQVGSRLLFRGYGVSDFMRPLHAALVGVDSILILDEAHLSDAFSKTLQDVRRFMSDQWRSLKIGKPMKIVTMTATPISQSDDTFTLTETDLNNPELRERLTKSKKTRLVTTGEDNIDKENKLVDEARKMMLETQNKLLAPVIGVIVNTVQVAIDVYEQLNDKNKEEVILLTGRVRQHEKDQILNTYLPRITAERSLDANSVPLYVIATQTVEVGANISFDGMVTEASSIDSLIQRFGRLNRLGKNNMASACIVYQKSSKIHPIYGDSIRNTWKLLEKLDKEGKLDFSPEKIQRIIAGIDDLSKLITPKKERHFTLMPSHLDMLVQTSPSPTIEPEVSSLLHGDDAEQYDVHVVWRAELPDRVNNNVDGIVESVAILPPTSYETVSVPVWALKKFLSSSKEHESDFTDLEGISSMEDNKPEITGDKYALLWRGLSDSRIIRLNEISPGLTVILPTSYGGYGPFGWNYALRTDVQDVADFGAITQRGKSTLRVHSKLIPSWLENNNDAKIAIAKMKEITNNYENKDISELCIEFIDSVLSLETLKPEVRNIMISLKNQQRVEIIYNTGSDEKGIFLQSKKRIRDFMDDDDSSSYFKEVELLTHSEGVSKIAEKFASKAGLPNEMVRSISTAALLHDVGKADPRFQLILYGGNKLQMRNDGRILAKSGNRVFQEIDSLAEVRQIAKYPIGTRHECYSVAIVQKNNDLVNNNVRMDLDMLLLYHLIGSHHGRGRPFLPSINEDGTRILNYDFNGVIINFDGKHGLEKLDSGWTEHFWELVRKYGYWGLAYLEAMVRLADHYQSSRGR